MTTFTHGEAASKVESGSAWGWFVALGVLFIALGVLAFGNLPAATVASVYTVGVFMLIGAVAQLVGAFFARSWSGVGLLVVSTLLYGTAAVVTISNPTLAALTLTLLLGISLILSGAMRVWWSLGLRSMPGSAWISVSGVVTAVAGMIFVAGWPVNTIYLLGLVLASDLIVQGAMAIGLGIALKAATR